MCAAGGCFVVARECVKTVLETECNRGLALLITHSRCNVRVIRSCSGERTSLR